MKKKRMAGVGMWLAMVLFLVSSIVVYAGNAGVTFGSNYYEAEVGTTFPIGVYITGDEPIGAYRVEIYYDAARMQYVSGASAAAEGVLILEGYGGATEVKHWLEFNAIAEGAAGISVAGVIVYGTEEVPTEFTIVEAATAPVQILLPEEAEEDETEEELTGDEEETPNEDSENAEEDENPEEDADENADNAEEEAENIDGENNGAETDVLEDTLSDDAVSGNGISDNAVTGDEQADDDSRKKLLIVLVIIVSLCLILWIGITSWINYQKEKKRRERVRRLKAKNRKLREEAKRQSKAPMETVEIRNLTEETTNLEPVVSIPSKVVDSTKTDLQAVDKTETEAKEPAWDHDVILEDEAREVVIDVQDVSMTYRIATGSFSGLKDYFIQRIKKQITTRELKALDKVDFKVYKGEVVGIIGTNGSGKSTLLKIVSGALEPSGGKVVVDHKKVQLLTLGTGFDMELTAKENVYLNGSIIGYSKEFLDKHYDEIVAFAELEGFMDEKVKNFSSGMVSRLGFAIATVADAAEILILDEVLSVGDEFFRKKSLARVKEMIHGGSTVLMVSHSMGTIEEHCTKAVWIEKGKLKMVGKPKEVCSAYRKMNQD